MIQCLGIRDRNIKPRFPLGNHVSSDDGVHAEAIGARYFTDYLRYKGPMHYHLQIYFNYDH